jgi:hypothetical protein
VLYYKNKDKIFSITKKTKQHLFVNQFINEKTNIISVVDLYLVLNPRNKIDSLPKKVKYLKGVAKFSRMNGYSKSKIRLSVEYHEQKEVHLSIKKV